MQNLNTIITVCVNSIITCPSLIYHTLYNKYRSHVYANSNVDVNIGSNEEIIVMFIHGRNGSRTDFDPLIENIKKYTDSNTQKVKLDDNFYILDTVDLGPTAHSSIDDDSNVLKQKLENYHNSSIILVGLSKGGVVAMRYATAENDSRIKKVITISSPVKGTMVASLFPSDSSVCMNLGFQCPIVKQINDMRIQKQIKTYHIVPKWDQLIIPSHCAKYDDVPDSQIYYYDGCKYSHSGIGYSEDVCLHIIDWIKS